MNRTSRLVIWDLDGTLVDSRQDIATAANAALQAIGRPILPLATVVSYVGDGIGTLIERLTPGGAAPERDACRAQFERSYAEVCCDQTAAYPGIIDVLTALRAAGHVQAVATNKALAYTLPILTHCGIAGYFAAIRGGDGRRKPDPWQLLDIGRELGLAPDWMVGDHHTDIRAGRAAGCRVAFCRWGLGRSDGDLVDVEIATPHELLDVI
jgi:phosphoglycolate phosphatase